MLALGHGNKDNGACCGVHQESTEARAVVSILAKQVPCISQKQAFIISMKMQTIVHAECNERIMSNLRKGIKWN